MFLLNLRQVYNGSSLLGWLNNKAPLITLLCFTPWVASAQVLPVPAGTFDRHKPLTFASALSSAQVLPVQIGTLDRHKLLTLANALYITLSQNANIKFDLQNTNIAYGGYLQNKGPFDTNLNLAVSRDNNGVPTLQSSGPFLVGFPTVRNKLTTFSTSASKTFHNGITIGPFVEMTRLETNLKFAAMLLPENRADVGFSIAVPLFKGNKIGLNEDSAYQSYKAQVSNYRFVIDSNLLDTISAYWLYAGSYQKLKVWREAIVRAKKTVKGIALLVEKDEVPRSQLSLAKANLANRQADYYSELQQYYAAKQALATAMGLHPKPSIFLFPRPGTKLARSMKAYPRTSKAVQSYYDQASESRNDLKALQLNMSAEHMLMRLTHNDLSPQVDLGVSVSYAGLHEGDSLTGSLTGQVGSMDVLGSLSYQYPIRNNAAKGPYLVQSARYTQTVINWHELNRTIRLSILLSLDNLHKFAAEYRLSKKALGYYRTSYLDEISRLKLGESTLVSVLDVEDRFVGNQLKTVNSQVSHARSVAQFLFDRGALVDGTNPKHNTINLDSLKK